MNLSWIDITIIAIYLIGITAFGIWVGYRKGATTEQYFLAGKSLGWFTVGAAVFTSNISTLHLVGLAAGGAKEGMVIGNFEWMACFTLVLLALLFAPFYIKTGVATLPEFMERRYCPAARTFLAVIGLLGALLIHIGISLFAAAKVFESFLGVPMYGTIIVLSLFTVTYTALGGLKAVVMTENIQVGLLLGGAVLVTVLGLRALPGAGVPDIAAFKAVVFPGQLNMLQPITNADGALNGFSWLGVILGYPILGIWYWCADQTHVQRVLGSKNLLAGQNGALFAGFLKITPVFLMVFPGVIGYVLWQRGAIHLPNLPGTNSPDYNTMLPVLINHLVPVGLKGLLAACMAAALMSCMAAALNSCATLISMDIVKRHRPDTPDDRVVRIGRITTGVIMVLAMLWSTQGDQFGTIFEAINKIPMTFAPAVTTVFVLGVMWKRGTKQAAMATLYAGSLIGAVYFVSDLPGIGRMLLGADRLPVGFAGLITDHANGLGIPFMLVGPMLAAVCVLIYVVTSLLTPTMDQEEVAKVCWNRPWDFLAGRLIGPHDPRVLAVLLLAAVGFLYYQLR
ncbi:sodium/solute symporter [Opitutus sp. GAS368]|uniref:sodium:solute symporter family transporter n=1 Tax=Opitutus sp. GAS368 TaxID=1882749 RepID=UPI00087BF82A|nr:sodium/solute symporter [Opitutus sp. GAS368]SDS18906.1 solute:Na+ symporter, SSS family [Opitutus sp. GAS368]